MEIAAVHPPTPITDLASLEAVRHVRFPHRQRLHGGEGRRQRRERVYHPLNSVVKLASVRGSEDDHTLVVEPQFVHRHNAWDEARAQM